jgi:hypothetical protein
MDLAKLKTEMHALLSATPDQRERQRLIYELGDMLAEVEAVIANSGGLPRVKDKARAFLAHLLTKAAATGAQFWQASYLLNSVGEAMARADYVAEPVLKFVHTGLYFHGLRYIERAFRTSIVTAMSAHAELVGEFCSRETLLVVLAQGRERMAEGRPFCLVHAYANVLRKRCWSARRKSEDACDVSVAFAGESESASAHSVALPAPVDSEPEHVTSAERVAILFEVFATRLSDRQRRIYLARHHVRDDVIAAAAGAAPPSFEALLCMNPADGDAAGRETWSQIAERFEVTEKSAKREYLRSLLILLTETSSAVFGPTSPSNFVRKMAETLRAVIQEKELRLKDNSGRGLGKVVQRWEVALRFVLNHSTVEHTAAVEDDMSKFR